MRSITFAKCLWQQARRGLNFSFRSIAASTTRNTSRSSRSPARSFFFNHLTKSTPHCLYPGGPFRTPTNRKSVGWALSSELLSVSFTAAVTTFWTNAHGATTPDSRTPAIVVTESQSPDKVSGSTRTPQGRGRGSASSRCAPRFHPRKSRVRDRVRPSLPEMLAVFPVRRVGTAPRGEVTFSCA
jgi:hypothetical protein